MVVQVNLRVIVSIAIVSILGAGSTTFAANTSTFTVGLVIGGKKIVNTSRSQTPARYTCGAAKMKISQAGYKNIRTLECNGNVYTFTAYSNSKGTNVGFNAITGKIIQM